MAARLRLCIALVVAGATAAAAAAVGAGAPVVKLADGQVAGDVSAGAFQYLGIPFAAPPVGDMRWRAPGAPKPWDGVLNATKFSHDCAQPPNSWSHGRTSEDCLYLNVYAPAAPATKGPLPVMLWFYGGTWISGGASIPLYDGVPDVTLREDVIIVSSNYRLGAFGFLGSEALANRTTDGSFGNYGLLDQRAAMQWVKSNIAAFGGNPDHVTIFGESAGAGSVACHIVMEGSKGLFQQAMMESGPMAEWVGMVAADAENRYHTVLQLSDCSTVDCLLGLTTAELEKLSKDALVPNIPDRLAPTQWGPVIDGVQLVGKPSRLAAAGKIASVVPTLLGSNHDEGSYFVPLPRNCSTAEVEELIGYEWGATDTAIILSTYPESAFKSPWFRLSRLIGDLGFTCAVRRTQRWMLAAGAPASYGYFMTHRPWWIDSTRPWLGVAHTSELPFVFNFRPFLHGPAEITLATDIGTYWMRFGATGNPNTSPLQAAAKMPEWPAYGAASDMVMNLNTTLAPLANLKTSACDMWDQLEGFSFR